MSATGVRLCWFCDSVLVAVVTERGQAVEHCPSPNCHWCEGCQRRRVDGEPLRGDGRLPGTRGGAS